MKNFCFNVTFGLNDDDGFSFKTVIDMKSESEDEFLKALPKENKDLLENPKEHSQRCC